MTVSEVSEKLVEKTEQIPQTLNTYAGQTAQTIESLATMGTQTRQALEQTTEQLKPVALRLQALPERLQEDLKAVEAQLQSASEGLQKFVALVADGQQQWEQSFPKLQSRVEKLSQEAPQTVTRLLTSCENGQTELRRLQQLDQKAHEELEESLKQAANATKKLGEACQTTVAKVKSLAETIDKQFETSTHDLQGAQEKFASEVVDQSKKYLAQLQELSSSLLNPRVDSLVRLLGADTDQAIKPCQENAKSLGEVLQGAGEQLLHQEQGILPRRQQVEKSLKEIQSGPQLKALLKAGKSVLQKVGKLSSLGPYADSL